MLDALSRFMSSMTQCVLYSDDNHSSQPTEDAVKQVILKNNLYDLGKFPNLVDVYLSDIKFRKRLKLPSTIRRLTLLHCSYVNLSHLDDTLRELSVNTCVYVEGCPPQKLTTLDLSWTIFTTDELKSVAINPLDCIPSNIQRLHVAGCSLSDDHLRRLSNLMELDCQHCRWITDEGIIRLTKLQALDCSSCRNITGDGIRELSTLNTLICYNCPKIGPSVLTYLPKLQRVGSDWLRTLYTSQRVLWECRHLPEISYQPTKGPTNNRRTNILAYAHAVFMFVLYILLVWWLGSDYDMLRNIIDD